MNVSDWVAIYKISAGIVWVTAIAGAIAYFILTLKKSYNGTDGEVGYIGKFYDKTDSTYKLFRKDDDGKTALILAGVFILVRIVSVMLALIAKKYILNAPLQSLFNELGRWDAPHYIDIANKGYISEADYVPDSGFLASDPWFFIVFYPLFPFIMKLFSFTGMSLEAASIVVPNVFAVLAIPVLYKLLRIDFSKNVSVSAVLLLIFNPFAFFFSFPFTESLFLFLSVSLFFCLRKEKWLYAGIFGFFAALTKNFGLILIVPYGVYLITVACKRHYNAKKFILSLLPVFMILLGFGVYLFINYKVYGDPFQFMIYQKSHWYNEISCIIKNMGNHFRYLISDQYSISNRIFLWLGDITAAVFMLSAVFIKHKKVPFVYNIYTLACIFLTLTVSWLLSGARYVLGAFGMYIPFAVLLGDSKYAQYAVYAVEFALGIVVLTNYFMGASIM